MFFDVKVISYFTYILKGSSRKTQDSGRKIQVDLDSEQRTQDILRSS